MGNIHRTTPTSAAYSDLSACWLLDRSIAFLNHGSFGACPVPVLEHQTRLRREMETSPVRFMVERLPALLAAERQRVATFVNADPQDIAFVSNATSAVNAVLRSLAFAPGDELLTTDHLYAACHNALDYVSDRWGANVVVAQVPFPIEGPEQVSAALSSRVSARTRLAIIDHVTSITGLVFPIGDIVRTLEAAGVPTLVDGAHAPGMVPLDLRAVGASYYAANFHKWVCAPKGAGLLWVRRDRQEGIVPPVVSHGYHTAEGRFHALFDWQGTIDPTAIASIGAALDTLKGLVPHGWGDVMARNRALAIEAQGLLSDCLAIERPAPEAMLGSLCSVPLPLSNWTARALHQRLVASGFETLVMPWTPSGSLVLRVSAQLYNTRAQYERLAEALPRVLAEAPRA